MGSWTPLLTSRCHATATPQPRTRNASTAVSHPDPRDPLRARLSGLTLEDEHRLRRRLDALSSHRRGSGDPSARAAARERIATDVAAAEDRIARRRVAVPAIRYPEELPVSARRDDIAA